MSRVMKLCVNCQYHCGADNLMTCTAPQDIEPLPLLGPGITRPRWRFCSTLRQDSWPWPRLLHTCGRSGSWFWQKEVASE